MSRDIKFRVWDEKSKCWFNFCRSATLYRKDDGEPDTIFKMDFSSNYATEQYTGLKDKNGKEIYGGDIIQCGAMVGVATMSEDLACWCIGQNPIWSTLLIERDADGDLVLPTTFIIGNIHENPELLNDGKGK